MKRWPFLFLCLLLTAALAWSVGAAEGDAPQVHFDAESYEETMLIGPGFVEEGVPFEHLERRLDELSRQTRVFFSTKTLTYLRKGGRISEAVYRLGSFLDIKPVITCDKAGYCAVANKARGWQRSLDAQVSLAVKHAATLRGAVRLVVACSEGNDHFDELEAKFRTQLASKGIEVVEPVVRSAISPDLLVHSGPDVVTIGVQPDWH